MAQVNQIKIGDNYFSPADWTSSDSYYSTVEFGTGAQSELVAFSYGEGGYVPGSPTNRSAQPVDTNLPGEGGRLPDNEAALVFAISVDFYYVPADGVVATDEDNVQSPLLGLRNILRIQRDVLGELQIASLQKLYKQAPIGFYAAGMGIDSGMASGAGANPAQGFVMASNGGASIQAVRKFASPEFIKGAETFGFVFRFPNGQVRNLTLNGNASDRILARTWFRGLRKRPVA